MKNRVQTALSVGAAVLLMWGVITDTVTAQPGRGGGRDGSGSTGTASGGGGRGGMTGGGPGGMMGGGPGGMMGGGPGGMMGGGPGGGGPGGLAQVLRTMDANGDGVLTMNEVPEQRRAFVTMIVQRMGRDPNQPIDLNALAASGSTPSATPASGSTAAAGGRSRGTTAAPLVAPFGEKTTAAGMPPSFGLATPVAAVVSTGASRAASSSLNPTERNARDLLDKHDKNRNGYLDKDKQEWNRTLPFDADRADKNRDGRLSMAEIVTVLGGKLTASSGAMVTSFRPSEAYDRLPAGVPDWFLQRDTDRDGQITMPEYIAGQPWSMGVAAEFEFLDLSADGIVTLTETFAVLQRIDEEKARKADAERREKERLRGGLAAMAPPPTTPEGAPNPEVPVDPNAPPPPPMPDGSVPPSVTPPSPPGAVPTASATPPAPPQPSSTAPYAAGSAPSSTSPRGGGSPQQRDPRGDRGARGSTSSGSTGSSDNRRSNQPR